MNHNIIYYKRQLWLSIFLIIFMLFLCLPLLIMSYGESVNWGVLFGYLSIMVIPFVVMVIYYYIQYNYSKKVNLKYIQKNLK